MNEAVSLPALGAVVALRLPDFLRAPVTEQASLKARAEALLELALPPLGSDARIVLDAPHGLVVALLSGPADALALASRITAAAGDLSLSIGMDYGQLRAYDHDRRGRGLVGNGIVSGMAVASAAAPGRIAVSGAFHEALESAAPRAAANLVTAGTFTDADGRTQEMYMVDETARPVRRRRLIAATAAGVAAILALGAGGRVLLTATPPRPAVLEFAVTPRSEVVVDGIVQGATPPLKRLEVSPGPRVIEIRAPGYPSLTLNVTLAPEQAMIIRHTFMKPPPKPRKKPALFDDLRRKLGI